MNTCQTLTDLCITKADVKSYNLTFTAGTAPIDITGATVSFTARSDIGGTVVISKEVTDHTDPTNGKTTITLETTDTNIQDGSYFYDIKIQGDTIPRSTVLKGKLQITWQTTED